ncbi:UNVERIFIED_CONTAM: hypothetical protein K2H54_027567, partial [Gekko kuhli]
MAALNECSKKRIRVEASCAVCDEFYIDPVQLCCGTSFCRACVAGRSPPVCPDCDAEFDPARLAPNRSLARLVEIAQQLLEREERREASAREGGGRRRGAAGADRLLQGGENPHLLFLLRARRAPGARRGPGGRGGPGVQ